MEFEEAFPMELCKSKPLGTFALFDMFGKDFDVRHEQWERTYSD
jgi:hypothetical protein